MNNRIYGPYSVEFQGPGVCAKITDELPGELAGRKVILKVMEEDITDAAVRTLNALGYTYHGGERWKPPIKQREPSYVTR